MARLKDMAVGVKDLFMLNPNLIQEEPGWNARIEGPELDAHIRQLADSIKEIGVQEPLTIYVRNEVPILTNGHCRLAAVRLAISEGAEIKAVPCRTEERHANDADRVLSLITRNSGKPLSLLEQASVVKRLLAFGWAEPDICKKTGFSRTHVSNLLALSGAPASVGKMVAAGEVSASLAVEVIREHGDKATEVLHQGVERAKADGKTRATPKHVAAPPPPQEKTAGNMPCPFCGGGVDPKGWIDSKGERGPECKKCAATTPSLEVWNSRAGQRSRK
jgi:ParB-like chromosome segregation protein Spo0J